LIAYRAWRCAVRVTPAHRCPRASSVFPHGQRVARRMLSNLVPEELMDGFGRFPV
jgi:hypothetical protein